MSHLSCHLTPVLHTPVKLLVSQTCVLVRKYFLSLPLALLDVDDAMTTESRTPNTTPPERRRENVSELSDVLEALQMVGRRNSQPVSTNVFLHECAPVVCNHCVTSPTTHSQGGAVHCVWFAIVYCVLMCVPYCTSEHLPA